MKCSITSTCLLYGFGTRSTRRATTATKIGWRDSYILFIELTRRYLFIGPFSKRRSVFGERHVSATKFYLNEVHLFFK